MIVMPLLAAAAAIAQPSAPSCSLVASTGFVDRITYVGRKRAGPLPTVTTPGHPAEPLRDVDYLCPGDKVLNPAGSSARVRLSIAGVAREIGPGEAAFIVPEPRWAFVGDMASRLARLFDGVDRGRHSIQPAIVRRGVTAEAVACSLAPGRLPPGDQMVLGSEPLTLKWDCADDAVPVQAIVAVSSGSKTIAVVDGLVRLSPQRDCGLRCDIRLVDRAGTTLDRIGIGVRSRAALAVDDAKLLDGDPPARALAGATLLQRPGWQVMGGSILLAEACRFPAAAAVAIDIYQFDSAARLCDAAVTAR